MHNLGQDNHSQTFSLWSPRVLRINYIPFLPRADILSNLFSSPLSCPHHMKHSGTEGWQHPGLEGNRGTWAATSSTGSCEMPHAKRAFPCLNSLSQTLVILSPFLLSPRLAWVSVHPAQHTPDNQLVLLPELWWLIWGAIIGGDILFSFPMISSLKLRAANAVKAITISLERSSASDKQLLLVGVKHQHLYC